MSDDNKLRQQIYNYKRKDRLYAESDPEYMDNLIPFLQFKTKEECVAFYRLWFGLYEDVLKEWDKVDDKNMGPI